MEQHPLVKAYTTFVINRTDHRIGIIGQPDAGKSTLINQLTGAHAHTSVHTDATLETTDYPFGNYGVLTDFPGVGTEEVGTGRYKKLIQQSGINHFIYVFASKIKDSDIEMIKFLSRQKKEIIFVYNKTDALIDVTSSDSVEALKRDKNTELKITMKPFIPKVLTYIFTSAVTNEGIGELKDEIKGKLDLHEQDFIKNYRDEKMMESYLNYKTNTLFPKLFTPSFKNVIMKQNYRSIERTVLHHFRIQEDDIIEQKKDWPEIERFIAEFEEKRSKESKFSQIKDVAKIIELFRTVFKMKSFNPLIMAMSSLVEAGATNAFPVMQAISLYISEIKNTARAVILASEPEYRK